MIVMDSVFEFLIEIIPQCEHFLIDSIQSSIEQQIQCDTVIGVNEHSGDLFVGHWRRELAFAAGLRDDSGPGIELDLLGFPQLVSETREEIQRIEHHGEGVDVGLGVTVVHVLLEYDESLFKLLSVIVIEVPEGIRAQLAVVDHHLIEEERIDDFNEQMFLALEIVVEGPLGKSGSGGDFVHRDFFETLLEEKTERSLQYMLFGILHKPTVRYIKIGENTLRINGEF
jgi:hypothetical protein